MTNWYFWFSSVAADAALWAQQKKGPAPEPPLPWWLPLAILGVLAYIMLIRPDRRRQKEHERMLQSLKQNDRVVTIGGIYGTVVSANSSESVVIRVDDTTNTRLRVLRSAISRIESDDKDKDKEKKDDAR